MPQNAGAPHLLKQPPRRRPDERGALHSGVLQAVVQRVLVVVRVGRQEDVGGLAEAVEDRRAPESPEGNLQQGCERSARKVLRLSYQA